MIKTMKLVFPLLLLFVFSNCATVQNPDMANVSDDIKAKQFKPVPGKSIIYIVRPSKFGGMGIYINPTIDKKVTGNLVSGSYLALEVLPGRHVISAAGDLETPEDTQIVTEAEKLYFIKMYPKLGAISPRLHNEIIGREEGQKLVIQNKRFKAIEYKPVSHYMTPSAGRSKLYIIRPSQLYGVAKKISPTVDNVVITTLESGTYVVTNISSGVHRISAAGKYEGEHILEFESTAEKNYFVKISPKMGFALPQLNLEMISQDKGIGLVGKCEEIKEK